MFRSAFLPFYKYPCVLMINFFINMLDNYSKAILVLPRYLLNKIYSLEGYVYFRNLLIILVLDSLVLDDEPLWEPLEWSVAQTWILYVYAFAWMAEVIFSSRYGSYTNRDKVVWIGLFKVYSFMKLWFVANIIFITVFITLPFYFEITYAVSYSTVWWNWYTSTFFFKLSSVFSVILVLANILRFQIRWTTHVSTYLLITAITLLILYLLYFLFLTTLFAFFTDPSEFKNSGWSNLSRVNHGPLKWGWGLDARDHFAYHRTTTVFWYKNDPLVAASMLFLNIFLFQFLFFLLLHCLALLRVVLYSGELSFNLATLFFNSLKQFFFFLLFLTTLILLSFIYQFMRFPFELYWFSKIFFLGQTQCFVILDFYTLLTGYIIY